MPTRREDGSLSRINFSFDEVHCEIPRKLAKLCKQHGVKSFIHMSALASHPFSRSKWSQSKAKGEKAVREEFPEAVISGNLLHFVYGFFIDFSSSSYCVWPRRSIFELDSRIYGEIADYTTNKQR